MRNKLSLVRRGLFSCVAVQLSASASAANFTRCEQSSSTPVDCLPGTGTPSLADTFTITAETSATLDSVFNWRVKNCKSRLGQLRGQLTLILDNSKSAQTTDTSATRAGVLNSFMQKFVENSLNSGVSTTSAGYPQLALVNYNGRVGTLDVNNRVDDYNGTFTPTYCTSPNPAFPDATALGRWNESESGTKLSICEYLPLRNAESMTAVSSLQQFATFAAQAPRGSTDFTYFFKAAGNVFQAANTGNVGRHVLTITDGLPNIPKNVSQSNCISSPRLQKEPIVVGPLFGQQREYCVDRQALQAISDAHAEAIKSDYMGINFHYVLYTADQRAYFDYDSNGQPNVSPADFLIENSARTGNGKVKFSYSKAESELYSSLTDMFDLMDANAIQYVSVNVQPAGGGAALSYKAVSPGEPGSEFSIKFVGLKQGLNTVVVTPVFQDGTSASKTFKVTVAASASPSTSAGLQCVAAGDDKTVDGDPIGTKSPKGDGFYHAPDSDGDFRDYRNADPGNDLTANEFATVDDEQAVNEVAKLRLQGGTGNCGVVAGRSVQKSSQASWLLLLIAIPLILVNLFKNHRRRKS